MRVSELNLLAYGKFTDHKLELPKATHDFHVIVGPNEAGKSTVRRAIVELLFGIEVRSPLGFKHPQSDLRVGAVLDCQTESLAFIRTKQHKSLRSLAGGALPDTFLAPALGALTQDGFEQLHCLDHERLLRGGQDIVNPKNPVSQILFQAASGLDGFAAVREALAARAAELFARAGRNNEFARASERFATAQRQLRDVQVRTKQWVEARNALTTASQELDGERQRRRELELLRTRWDRVRRLAPMVDRLARLQDELESFGETVSFPSNARQMLEDGIAAINVADAKLQTREEDVVRARQNAEDIEVESNVLEYASDIQALSTLCGLHPNHVRDLPLRRAEVEGWMREVLERSCEFGWGDSEEEVRKQVPADKLLRGIDALLKSRGELLAEERSARELEAQRRTELMELQEALASAANGTAAPGLVEALTQALVFKSSESKQKTLLSAAKQAQAVAQNAMAALARPELTQASLRSMQLPSTERVAAYRKSRQDIAQAVELAASLAQQSQAAVDGVKLQMLQFARSHKLVTFSEVSEARKERDEKWQGIKTGTVSVSGGGPHLELAIRLADELADAHTLSETDSAELQALRDQLEKDEREQSRHEQALRDKQGELNEFDARWAEAAASMGLKAMELDDLPEWLARRETALNAIDTAAEKQHAYELERDGAAQVRAGLQQSMLEAGLSIGSSTALGGLCAAADDHVNELKLARSRRQDLEKQLLAAQTALKVAKNAAESKIAAAKEWTDRWNAVLASAHLTGVGDDVAEVEAAVAAAQFVRSRIERVETLRNERIKTMEADIQGMEKAAASLAQVLAPELVQRPAEEVSRHLNARLETAKRQSDRKLQAQKGLDNANQQRDRASSERNQAKRSLEPLLKAAGVDSPMLAVQLVERWQSRVDTERAISETRKLLEQDADGLSLEAIRTELANHPASEAAEQVMTLKDRLSDSEQRLTGLVEKQLAAKQAFDAIHGGDTAAIAEAQKQEALADLADISEEYLQLATANSLLKWAVDRYRDRKQGPLLERASSVFCSLTRGAFERLRVDYDQTPPALLAYRPNNHTVKIAGLSDGTRDQLFLALRIAALELQAEQGTPVPFVADDLFINFDDERSKAGLAALYELSAKTQVLFMTHHEHLLPVVQQMLPKTNIITLHADEVSR
jgi:chromosome segregation protein